MSDRDLLVLWCIAAFLVVANDVAASPATVAILGLALVGIVAVAIAARGDS